MPEALDFVQQKYVALVLRELREGSLERHAQGGVGPRGPGLVRPRVFARVVLHMLFPP